MSNAPSNTNDSDDEQPAKNPERDIDLSSPRSMRPVSEPIARAIDVVQDAYDVSTSEALNLFVMDSMPEYDDQFDDVDFNDIKFDVEEDTDDDGELTLEDLSEEGDPVEWDTLRSLVHPDNEDWSDEEPTPIHPSRIDKSNLKRSPQVVSRIALGLDRYNEGEEAKSNRSYIEVTVERLMEPHIDDSDAASYDPAERVRDVYGDVYSECLTPSLRHDGKVGFVSHQAAIKDAIDVVADDVNKLIDVVDLDNPKETFDTFEEFVVSEGYEDLEAAQEDYVDILVDVEEHRVALDDLADWVQQTEDVDGGLKDEIVERCLPDDWADYDDDASDNGGYTWLQRTVRSAMLGVDPDWLMAVEKEVSHSTPYVDEPGLLDEAAELFRSETQVSPYITTTSIFGDFVQTRMNPESRRSDEVEALVFGDD